MTPDVSVLMSVCGTGDWLGEALLSLMQSDANYQLVIRANGSAEVDTVERLTLYVPQERRVVLAGEETATVSDSLNETINCIRARWAMRLDQDDALPPGALESMIEAADKHPGQPVVYGDYLDHAMNPRLHEARPATAEVLYVNNAAPYNYLMPTALLREVGGWRENGYEDWDLLIRLMAAGGEWVILEEVTLFHRVRADGLLAEYMQTHEDRVQAIRESNAEFFENENRRPE